MESYRESMVSGSADLIAQIRRHPFILQTMDGSIADGHFRRFATQNYLRLREFERFLALLSARAPESVRDKFCRAMIKNHEDIEWCEELAARLDINLARTPMTFACHAGACQMLATVCMRSFEEALTVCYGTDFALHEGWTHALPNLRTPNRWQEFIDLWGGESIARWVESLGEMIDTLAVECPPKRLQRMTDSFRASLYYRLRFWDMAFQEADW